jgi:hypothetical protein
MKKTFAQNKLTRKPAVASSQNWKFAFGNPYLSGSIRGFNCLIPFQV